ncbi:Hypothetical protein FKW44_001157 [Caligus rogercresseyi]|uniref:Uncharacterized protein n=1 Tax=Caligus rogercresseyi TaxID=217165 RepID=A0A7T8QVE5_CALRO|nr:Hypothetical protein FKW44_001157 [Caligus rogercresseyi]
MEEEEDDKSLAPRSSQKPSVSPVTEGMSTNRRVPFHNRGSTLKRRRKKEKEAPLNQKISSYNREPSVEALNSQC